MVLGFGCLRILCPAGATQRAHAHWRKAPRQRGAIDPQEMVGEREGAPKKRIKVEKRMKGRGRNEKQTQREKEETGERRRNQELLIHKGSWG